MPSATPRGRRSATDACSANVHQPSSRDDRRVGPSRGRTHFHGCGLLRGRRMRARAYNARGYHAIRPNDARPRGFHELRANGRRAGSQHGRRGGLWYGNSSHRVREDDRYAWCAP